MNGDGTKPLSFAPEPDDEQNQVDEHQLEDLWDNMHRGKFQGKERWCPKHTDRITSRSGLGSTEGRHGKDQSTEKVKADLLTKRNAWAPTESLSVSRHVPLAAESVQLLQEQLLEVADMLEDSDSEEDVKTAEVDDLDLTPQPRIGESFSGPLVSPHSHGEASTVTTPALKSRSQTEDLSPDRTKTRWRRVRGMAHISGIMTANERKEKRDREKALRQKELCAKIAEPLP